MNDDRVRLELAAADLARLLATGALRPVDFRCMDMSTKSIIHSLLLHAIRRPQHCHGPLAGDAECACGGRDNHYVGPASDTSK